MRFFIALDFLVYLLYFFAPYYYPYLYGEKIVEAIYAFPIYQAFSLPEWFAWMLLACRSAVIFLLLMYGSKVRHLFLLLVLGEIMTLCIISGVYAFVSLDFVLSFLVNAIDGVLLLALYGLIEIRQPLIARRSIKSNPVDSGVQ